MPAEANAGAAAAAVSLANWPLAGWAEAQLTALAALAPTRGERDLAGVTLLGERAALNGFVIPGAVSAGGGCRLLPARDDHVALNLARREDRELLPALFGDAAVTTDDDADIAARVAGCEAAALVARGRELGLAVADLAGQPVSPPFATIAHGRSREPTGPPLVVDLTALWAGPLAANLLAMGGARVVKVESRNRPDAMRTGDPALFARLNGGKASVVLDLRENADRAALVALLRRADVVIEAARSRALRQLGIDADALVGEVPGLVWLTITGHGVTGPAADWVGFGDDCGVAGGLSAALLGATGTVGFVGDAIADPLAGLIGARAVLEQRARGRGARLVLAMAAVAAKALAWERARDAARLDRSLRAWAAARGAPFPAVPSRPSAAVRPLGADNAAWLAVPC